MNARLELWAKDRGLVETYPLACHLLDTATAALALWDTWMRPGLRELISRELGANARAWAGYDAGSHDVGKAYPLFQFQPANTHERLKAVRQGLTNNGYDARMRPTIKGMLPRHEQVSALNYFTTTDWNEPAADNAQALVALAHHGWFDTPDFRACRTFRRDACGEWAAARGDLDALVRRGVGLADEPHPRTSPTATILLAGLTVLADRLASMAHAIEPAQAAMRAGELTADEPAGWVSARSPSFERLIEQELGVYQDFADPVHAIFGTDVITLRPLQEEAPLVGQGLWVAMAPTGSGKTEAALLRHASAAERLIFCLPTQATTNAMMVRIQKAYRDTPNAAALLHSMASLEDFYTRPIKPNDSDDEGGLFPSHFVQQKSARLLAPVSVGTIDQVLKGALPLKWTHLRLLALANAHVVVDEVHTLDQYQSELLRVLMRWWGLTGTRVSLLSATLPTWQRDTFAKAYQNCPQLVPVEFPSSHVVGREPTPLTAEHYRISLQMEEVDEQAASHIAWLTDHRRQFPDARLGIICNVVKRAQQVAQAAVAHGEDVIVLHSRMTAEHRRLAADRLLDLLGPDGDGRAVTVVGTQTLEASLNIDLDALSTDLAPAPSLIQRAGRVWRFNDPRRARRMPSVAALPLRVVRGAVAGWELPYFRSELGRTWMYLIGRDHLDFPQDVQQFVETATLSLDDAEALEELASRALSAQIGKSRTNGLVNALAPDATIDDVSYLTMRGLENTELATRLIDQDVNVQVLLLGDPLVVPGAWDGTVRELASITADQQDLIRRAMRASITLSYGLARRALNSSDRTIFQPQAPVLQRFIPIRVGELFDYDPVLGLAEREEQ